MKGNEAKSIFRRKQILEKAGIAMVIDRKDIKCY